MFTRILVPVDGSDTSNKALAAAVRMTQGADGRMRLVHVMDELAYAADHPHYGSELMRAVREEARRVLSDASDVVAAASLTAEASLIESPGRRLGDVIAEEAKRWNADLVVVGTHGRRGFARALLGSGADQIIRTSPVPVLVVPPPSKDAASKKK